MARKCFLSFYYKEDNWRVQQIKNIGSIEEQPLLTSNQWAGIKKKGDDVIKEWIENNMRGKECLIVLVGTSTAARRWVKYEIRRACEKGIGVMGDYIHNLKDAAGKQVNMGTDPFKNVVVDAKTISTYATMYDPRYATSTYVYDHIKENLSGWVESAIRARK